jgi:bifunctional DNase/RNase
MKKMVVDSIRVSLMNYQRVVILKEEDTSRYLPIWIGAAEADAITIKLQETLVQRPLTHDLMQSIIIALGDKVNSIVIDDLQKDIFFARVILDVNQLISQVEEKVQKKLEGRFEQAEKWLTFFCGEKKTTKVIDEWEIPGKKLYKVLLVDNKDIAENKINDRNNIFEISHEFKTDEWLIIKIHIDSRSSDAIALAVRGVEVPIYAEDDVLNRGAVWLDKETGKPVA